MSKEKTTINLLKPGEGVRKGHDAWVSSALRARPLPPEVSASRSLFDVPPFSPTHPDLSVLHPT